jgi:NitT/TauT family transport system permease protein
VSISHGVVAADPAQVATLEHDQALGGDAPEQDAARPRSRRTAKGVLADVGPPALVFALFIGVWYAFSYWLLSKQRRFLVPPPHKVINTSFFNTANRDALLDGLWLSTKVAALGLLIAIIIGMVLAVIMSQAKWAERSIYPYAVALQTIPILALTPLIGFWFDFNFKSRVIVCVIISLFPIIANTLFGLQSVDRGHQDLFRLHGAGRFTRLVKLQFPAALPAIFTGLRISAGLTVVGAIVGDFFFRRGSPGLGVLIYNYQQRLQSEQMYGALILTVLLGIVTFWIFGYIGHKVVGSWHDSAHRQS